ncbi:MAG TPA: aminoacyl-tRNA hydrolase [Candidatus Saccharimonadales bacterium]|nr:aminoacyl-tRNA hydrolase [Candidatus Saccharimonadales bacterium]
MKIVVGLGNIGEHFNGTRHNVGFAILDSLTDDWHDRPKFKSFVAEVNIGGEKVILLKPKTYYNLSGDAVIAVKNFYKVDARNILAVHDELALPFGAIRTRNQGSDAGNNGIKSLIAQLGPDFARVRIGIANDFTAKTDAADFVLGHFTREELKKMPDIAHSAKKMINNFVTNKFEQTSVNP